MSRKMLGVGPMNSFEKQLLESSIDPMTGKKLVIESESIVEERFNKGDRVKISDGSGVISGKTGVIVDKSAVKTDGRGIPTNVQGAYKPVDWSKEVAIKLDNGDIETMFKNRVTKVVGEEDSGEVVSGDLSDQYEIVDMGWDNPSYFQGFGTSFTKFDEAIYDVGSTPRDAVDQLKMRIWEIDGVSEAVKDAIAAELDSDIERIGAKADQDYYEMNGEERPEDDDSGDEGMLYHIGVRVKSSDGGKKKMGESKSKTQDLPGTNMSFRAFARDVNGNTVVRLVSGDGKGFSIQTNGNLPKTHAMRGEKKLSDEQIKVVAGEVSEYVSKYHKNMPLGSAAKIGESGNPMNSWDVYLKGKKIDTVFYTPDCDAEYVKKSLVDHDGYDPAVSVKLAKKAVKESCSKQHEAKKEKKQYKKAFTTEAKEPTADHIKALSDFAAKNGKDWKSKLTTLWQGKGVNDHLLQQVRNQFGPEWLKKFSLPKAKDESDGEEDGWNLDAVNEPSELDGVLKSDAPAEIKAYAKKKQEAMKLRMAGKINDALRVERLLDKMYNKLPEHLKTW